jgi:hypothetical protein
MAAIVGLGMVAAAVHGDDTLPVLCIARGAALWSTAHALERGAVELNPLGQTWEKRAAAQLVVIGAGTLVIHGLNKRSPKWGKRLLIGLVVASAVETGWNLTR